MNTRSLIVPIAFAVAAGGCATAPAPEPQASAGAQECRVVAVYSATDVLRNQNARGVPGSAMARADGATDSGRIAAAPPAELRAPAKLDSTMSKLAREC